MRDFEKNPKSEYEIQYKKLNQAQKEAVDSIDGPVMVVAGPGTGKTQILALRIGNILLKTDTSSDGILCLTFTNSAVSAMRDRLRRYIGTESSKVKIFTFHGFGMEMLEKYHGALGLADKPEMMDERHLTALADEILEGNDWEHLRPRGDSSRYFRDLKNFVSLLKREGLKAEDFERGTREEIKNIENDPDNISTRGESKGRIKKEAEKKIEGLRRTLEAVKFYSLYEQAKKSRNLFDYDDILEALVIIADESEEARNYIKENFLYILIDEHQDSSGVQNKFLEKVWGNVEKPNIFVVGDDRQLIYGFGGASLQYFENFKHSFGKAKLITLTENYRSTQKILDSSHNLLQSSISSEKLKSNSKESHAIRLVEAYYPRDEIIFAGLEIKEKIEKGENPDKLAILVPKNRQVKSALSILKDLNIPAATGDSVDFFDMEEAHSFLGTLQIIAHPGGSYFAQSLFDPLSGIPPLRAHEFLKNSMRDMSLLDAPDEKNNLFGDSDPVLSWIRQLKSWISFSGEPLYGFVQRVGTELLLNTSINHKELISRIEVLRTVLHLVLFLGEKSGNTKIKITLSDFLVFMDRIKSYGEKIPVAVFSPEEGVRVLTLHGSKGLEFDSVWIAHMDEKSFTGSARDGFTLPEFLKEKLAKKDELAKKRELYVAITRAKRFCTISYALSSYSGKSQELSRTVSDISDDFKKQQAAETEKIILDHDPKTYVAAASVGKSDGKFTLSDLAKLVARDYEDRKVSVSLLNNFFECPWKWYFKSLLKLPEPKSESLEFGNIIHGSVSQILKASRKPGMKDLESIVNSQIRKSGFGDERKQKEFFALAVKIISAWAETRLSEVSADRQSEQSVSVRDDRFPNLLIYGSIDLIEKLGKDRLRVTDFKTGKERKKSDIEKMSEDAALDGALRMSNYMRQLAMYSFLLNQSPKWKAVVSESRLEFLEAKGAPLAFYDTTISDEQIQMVVKDIMDYDLTVKSGEWINRPCNYNSYGKTAACPYCEMAEIYRK